ncbi:MAG TPA: transglycosylase domain-containing protein [Pyrinomonadaceae bacterium]|jgi:monofunctional biosynthetic peptidoglycan transglycosylase
MWGWIKRIFLGMLIGLVVALLYVFISYTYTISKLRDRNPASTSLIDYRIQEAQARGEQPKRMQTWVELERISPHLQRAVLAGEDTNFATHHGFDYEAIQRAWDDAQREAEKESKQEGDDPSIWDWNLPNFKRGASTITQQLAKNLYLSSERSFLRKGREAVITFFLERELSKRRILEIYLNVIEWGDGIYGAEAASQYYFKKPAAELTQREAAFLSAMIPSPLNIFNPQKNLKRVQRRQKVILRGMPYVKMPQGTG